jgi:23S rRNA (cytosine1962-C5)-methyltransferase
VVDRYGSACVVQIGTAGMEKLKPQIQQALEQVLRCEALLFKNDGSTREMEGLPSYVEAAKGKFDEMSLVVEDGLEFQAPLVEGQKTGWFFDQAANRRALIKYVRKGARVLDMFSYVGAWGVRAAHSGAGEVLCVDSSAAALELAASNAERNRVNGRDGGKLTTTKGDAFDVLEDLAKKRARFDLVVIDPPAFAKRKKDVPKALAAYKRLNQLAMQLIADDGILPGAPARALVRDHVPHRIRGRMVGGTLPLTAARLDLVGFGYRRSHFLLRHRRHHRRTDGLVYFLRP